MNRFAALLDRLAYEPSRNSKLRLLTEYFRTTPDPDRGYALAAITGALAFRHAKPGIIRALIAERSDPMLFELSYDYVGDLSETVALMWPAPRGRRAPLPPRSGGEGWGWGADSRHTHPVGACGTATPTPPATRCARGWRGAHRPRGNAIAFPRRHHARLARQIRAAGATRRLARCARRDRALGAVEARHRRAAHRRVGAARQDRGRGARRQESPTRSSWCGTASRRPMRSCSPGSKAAARSRSASTRRRSAR